VVTGALVDLSCLALCSLSRLASGGPMAMGLVSITFGMVIVSIHAPSPDRVFIEVRRLGLRVAVGMERYR
jgi:hypothetical protein